MKIELCDGKYTYLSGISTQNILRYGKPWRDETGDEFLLAMAARLYEAEEKLANIEKILRLPVDLDEILGD